MEIFGTMDVIKAKTLISMGFGGWSHFHEILSSVFNNHEMVIR